MPDSAESVAGYCPHGEPYDDKDPCPDAPRYAESVAGNKHGHGHMWCSGCVPNECEYGPCCVPNENPPDRYQRVQDFIDSCSEIERQVAILRLCRMDNDGSKHFDHGEPGYSWACLACQQMGRGALGGWVGALQMLGTLNDGAES